MDQKEKETLVLYWWLSYGKAVKEKTIKFITCPVKISFLCGRRIFWGAWSSKFDSKHVYIQTLVPKQSKWSSNNVYKSIVYIFWLPEWNDALFATVIWYCACNCLEIFFLLWMRINYFSFNLSAAVNVQGANEKN